MEKVVGVLWEGPLRTDNFMASSFAFRSIYAEYNAVRKSGKRFKSGHVDIGFKDAFRRRGKIREAFASPDKYGFHFFSFEVWAQSLKVRYWL